MLDKINENNTINNLAKYFCRSPFQKNALHESDAEIIEIGGVILAITTDSIAEEIQTGLYDDPYLVGWMSVMVNMSDLAAVGAEPVGILISEILPGNIPSSFIDKIQEGINDAVKQCGTFVLGGDTNTGENLIITGTAIGRCTGSKTNSGIDLLPEQTSDIRSLFRQ